MKNLLLLFSFFTPLVWANCDTILEKKCENCTNLNIVVEQLYERCQASVQDLKNIISHDKFTQQKFSSLSGYVIAFGNIASRAMQKKVDFIQLKKEFENLKNNYDVYRQDNQKFLTSLALLEIEHAEFKKEIVIKEDKLEATAHKYINQLNYMLKSAESLDNYKMYEEKFKNIEIRTSDSYSGKECEFLKLAHTIDCQD